VSLIEATAAKGISTAFYGDDDDIHDNDIENEGQARNPKRSEGKEEKKDDITSERKRKLEAKAHTREVRSKPTAGLPPRTDLSSLSSVGSASAAASLSSSSSSSSSRTAMSPK
jgi:hypothetical protein